MNLSNRGNIAHSYLFMLMNTLTTSLKNANQHSVHLPLNWYCPAHPFFIEIAKLLIRPLPPEVLSGRVEVDKCLVWKVRQKQDNRRFPRKGCAWFYALVFLTPYPKQKELGSITPPSSLPSTWRRLQRILTCDFTHDILQVIISLEWCCEPQQPRAAQGRGPPAGG